MRIRFLRGTALGGVGNDAYPGDVRELAAAQAALLIAGGRAVAEPDDAAPAAPTAPEPLPRTGTAPPPSRKKGK